MMEYLRAGRWEKKLDLMFTEELQKCIGSIQYGGIETFCLLRHVLIWRYWNILGQKIVYEFCDWFFYLNVSKYLNQNIS